MAHYQNQNAGDDSWSEVLGDIYSGMSVGAGHSKWYLEHFIETGWAAIASLSGIDVEQDNNNDTSTLIDIKNEKNQPDGLKVIGVGYGRTGTYSLALALDELGFPTLHTQHLYENGEIFDHLVNNIFYKSIKNDEVVMGEPDFDLLVKGGYTATMDLPFALYFNQIQEQYPDIKFILTVRDNSDIWFRSWNILTQSISKPVQHTSFFVTHSKKLEYYMRWLFSVVNEDTKYLSHPFPLPPQNRERAIQSYENHNQRVRDSISSSHLLEYSVKEGWEPLCNFLEIPEAKCPSTHGVPFPKSNSARAVRWQAYSAFIIFLSITLFIIFLLFSVVFRKITSMSVVDWCRVQKRKFLRLASDSLEDRRKKKGGTKMD